MWQLSTLGGACSAMGEYDSKFVSFLCSSLKKRKIKTNNNVLQADYAAFISIKQLQLAIEHGDPILISRCRLFIALALIQKDQLAKAKTIIR